MEILYKYQTTALLTDIFFFWFRAVCELHVPLASYGRVVDFCAFCLRIPGVASIVRPHPDY